MLKELKYDVERVKKILCKKMEISIDRKSKKNSSLKKSGTEKYNN